MPLITPETALSFGKPFTPETGRIAGLKGGRPKSIKPRKPTDYSYPAVRLRRVRRQINRLSERIDEELAKLDCDGQRVNWLCTALERLSEQERILANRPLPGSLKPTQERPTKRNYLPEPREAPQPTVAQPLHEAPSIAQPTEPQQQSSGSANH